MQLREVLVYDLHSRYGDSMENLDREDGVRMAQRTRTVDAHRLDDKETLRALLEQQISDKPFNELFAVTLSHEGACVLGSVLLDELDRRGFGAGTFDAVGALTAAAVPVVTAMVTSAAQAGFGLDGFVMDFVYPSIKGPSIEGKKVILVDAWLSEKSYVQTSSLVTLHNGNELSLDFGIVSRAGAQVLAVASLIGGVDDSRSDAVAACATGGSIDGFGEVAGAMHDTVPSASASDMTAAHDIQVVDPVDGGRRSIPFVMAFEEHELRRGAAHELDGGMTRNGR